MKNRDEKRLEAKEPTLSLVGPSCEAKSDYSKLVSLLALAAGAVAIPQTSNADIIYTDLSSSPAQVGFGSTSADTFVINTLPGTAQLGFATHHSTHTTIGGLTTYKHRVTAAMLAGSVLIKTNGTGLVVANSLGKRWGTIAGFGSVSGTLGRATDFGHTPNNFSNKYLAFEFMDSTPGGGIRFGWVGISLANGNLSNPQFPNVTITGYAYDNTGAQIPMGATPPIPEPGSLALTALALGAVGVRSWRRHRTAATQ